jgi:long-subunit fatty acid transport protein
MHSLKPLLVLIFLFFFCQPLQLFAAGVIFQNVEIASSPNPVGSGARALGMGGAFIAVADDATAASWNPAGLINLELPEVSVVGAVNANSSDFFSSSHSEVNTSSSVNTDNLNYISAAYPFVLWGKNMGISLNYQHLYDFTKEYSYNFRDDATSTSQFELFGSQITTVSTSNTESKTTFDQQGSLGALGLAYAVKLSQEFWLGLTLNIWRACSDSNRGWESTVFRNTEVSGSVQTYQDGILVSDVPIGPLATSSMYRDLYEDFAGENFNLGFIWDVNSHVTLGGVIKTPFKAEMNHISTNLSLDPPTVSEEVRINMPMSYGAGIAYRFSDNLTIDLDLYKTLWSDYTITDSQGNEFNAVTGSLRSQSNIKDTTQLRLGGEYLHIPEKGNIIIPFRAGLFYDPEPMEGDVKDFYGVSIGSGIVYKQFVFDAAYQFRWGRNQDADNLIPNADARVDEKQHTLLASIIYHF